MNNFKYKEKKIGIVTINDNNNYENRLQNYVVQDIGIEVRLHIEYLVKKQN